MISRAFTNEQARQHICYSITCGFEFEKFICGKGLYGNRVSLMRNKDPSAVYKQQAEFKTSVFHAIEGLKPLEYGATITFARNKIEAIIRDKESMRDYFKNNSGGFVTANDLESTLNAWYTKVSRKLITNSYSDFKALDDFVINAIMLILPISEQELIGTFRAKQLNRLVKEGVLEKGYADERIQALPGELDKLIALKQKLLSKK
ncbi:MAG: hypothetical protein FWE53_00585 [Firmicutes bacterium]|nr:hypothetical protein [Bacillota bacterium]